MQSLYDSPVHFRQHCYRLGFIHSFQAADWVSQDPYVTKQIMDHPEFWLHDDFGNVINFSSVPIIDHANAAARTWFANLPLQNLSRADGALLVDGIFVDGTSFRNGYPNVSAARYAQSLFPGKMKMMQEAQSTYRDLNGGNVWGNPLLEYGDITGSHPTGPSTDWNTTLYFYDAAFDEMFGSFGTLNANPNDGQWNATKMAFCFEAIQNATDAGKGVIVHAFPGPANPPFSGVPNISSAFPAWDGPVPRPSTVAGLQAASQAMLVQSLAPYLIVASETTFFSYAWFYDWETGYGACPDAPAHCSAPPAWYPEFSKPLGKPLGKAQRKGTVWTREFEGASVYVDLADRALSAVTWRAAP